MTLLNNPGVIKKFKRASWSYQTTFITPLKKLDVFVPAILSANDTIKEASLTIDSFAFEPKNLIALTKDRMLSEPIQHDTTLTVIGHDCARELLQVALSDWLDFAFVPVPKLFAMYADHDEYSTFYSNTLSNLERIKLALLNNGFKQVSNYDRKF